MTVRLRCACEAHSELRAGRLGEGGPTADTCPSCDGALLAMADYRRWRDSATAGAPAMAASPALEDQVAARPCPKCTRLMQRLRVGASPDFRLDRCAACALLWFDRGEWSALCSAGLASRLEEVLSERWQRDLQANEARQRRETLLRDKHGAECMDELARMREWLQAQKHPDELLALLRAGW
jgi:Zn-finger nucleic acid-binding protein